jgi:long-chain acyl-CoA synthetase
MSETTKYISFAGFLEHISLFKDRPALSDATSGKMLTFSDLYVLVLNIVRRLPADIPVGERVVLYGLEPLEWVPVFFAAALRGWIVVPLDTRISGDFFHSVEELTLPKLIIVGEGTEITSKSRVMRYREILAGEIQLENNNFPEPDSDMPAEILFTSGTWARPKGVVLSQRNILSNSHQILQVYKHAKDDTSLAVLPLSHAYQQTAGLFLPLSVGSHIVFLTKLNSEALAAALQKNHVQTMLVVPRILSLLESGILRKIGSHRARRWFARFVRMMRFAPRAARRLIFSAVHARLGNALQTFVVGGAPLAPELDHFFQGLGYRIIVGFGASECSPVISISLNQRRSTGEIGIPLPKVNVELNEKSEMVISGANLFLGYWPHIRRPKTFNTEDVAVRDSMGRLHIRGRTKNLVVYPSGDKIFCEDIEYIANQIPGVEDCCAVSIPSKTGIQLHCAVKGDHSLKSQEVSIREAINKKLPFGVHVDGVTFIHRDDFPYTHTLKANRQRIQAICLTSASEGVQG